MTYQFDEAFQKKVAAFYMRDETFSHATEGLIDPAYFQNQTLAGLVWTHKSYWESYKTCPSLGAFVQHMKDQIAAKRVQFADMVELQGLLREIHRPDACPTGDRQFVIDKIAGFAKHKAMENASLELVDALDSHDVTKIDKAQGMMTSAFAVGAADVAQSLNFNARRQERAAARQAIMTGAAAPTGITTGNPQLDSFLFPHMGWGRKELAILLGPPKSGKTAGLVSFAKAAAEAGLNVYYASCEVSAEIIEDRLDSNISGVPIKELRARSAEALAAGDKFASRAGRLEVQSFPTGTLKVSELRRILKKFESEGVKFDLVITDYIDIMGPERRESDKRHELSQITRDLRALMVEMNAAGLSATQTNREGTRKAAKNVTDGTDVAEDYDKVRLADALITINHSPEDRQNGEVVLYFSEMRNTEGGLRLRFNQDISCMRFITGFVGKE